MKWCIQFDDTPKYFQMIAKYFDKNSTGINKEMNKTKLICLAVENTRDLEWFKTIFDLYIKMNKVPSKEDFESAFKNKHFKDGMSKECEKMIKINYYTFYPRYIW